MQTSRLDRRRDPRARTPAASGTDALETLTPVLLQLRTRSRSWIAALFLLVASLSAASTAFGWTCLRAATDATAVVAPGHAEHTPAQHTDPGLASIACGAPALTSAHGATLVVPPLRNAPQSEPAAQPAPAPDLAPHERPPLQR